MKLRFLGQAYSDNQNQMETIGAKHTARFLGQSYIPRRPLSVVIKPTSEILKYCDVDY